jgi:homotetrameric NADPH-dependent glutamate synthase
MYRIVEFEQLSEDTFAQVIEAPEVAEAARPGHFVMVRIDKEGERIPLTIADYDRESGTVTLVVKAVGKTTIQMMGLRAGDSLLDFVGPLGLPADIHALNRVVLVGGGLGVGPIYPQLREYKRAGAYTIVVVGFRTRDRVFWEDRFREFADEFYISTDDESYGVKGPVTLPLGQVCASGEPIDRVVAIGPLEMMRACGEVTRPFDIPTIVSLNSIMVDGTGMCGSCRVTVDSQIRFACVDGPEFDGHKIDFEEILLRQKRFEREEQAALERFDAEACALKAAGVGGVNPAEAPSTTRRLPPIPEAVPPSPRDEVKKLADVAPEKVAMPAQPALERTRNFDEVSLGYSLDQALEEADRCILCTKPHCLRGCPVRIDIPGFIESLQRKDIKEAYRIIKDANSLPAVCGRVCPQESQCEAACIVGEAVEPVAIGRLERFVADAAVGRHWDEVEPRESCGKRAAIVGSGPAGLACAGDLAKAGVDVTIYEALHVPGGVLKYGIPEFRLPNDIIDIEIDNLERLGVKIEVDKVIGKVFSVPELLEKKGFDAVFLGTGAGMPAFLGIPGEALNGVFSANEFLTRVNLMRGFEQPLYDTPVGMGQKVAIIGASNTAIDAARVALRMGADEVSIVYRRSQREAPARAEELLHAEDEGIGFRWLTQPVGILGDSEGWVNGLKCIRTRLGPPDRSRRRRPIAVAGSEFVLELDTVVYAIGTHPNPIIQQSLPNLELSDPGTINVDEETRMTSVPGIFSGGDVVTGSATVILAMGAGRKAAAGMLQYMGIRQAA